MGNGITPHEEGPDAHTVLPLAIFPIHVNGKDMGAYIGKGHVAVGKYPVTLEHAGETFGVRNLSDAEEPGGAEIVRISSGVHVATDYVLVGADSISVEGRKSYSVHKKISLPNDPVTLH